MTNDQSARTIKKVSVKKSSVKKLLLPTSESFRNVLLYTTSKGLVFIIPQGMDGISFRRWKESHQNEINDWIKNL